MKEVKVKKLEQNNFAKYGEFQNLLDEVALAEKSVFSSGFFADVVKLDFGSSTLPAISVCHVKKQEKNIISMLEAHKFTCEGLLPLDDDVIIFAGVMFPGRKFSVDSVEAFYVPRGTFVKLNPLILHGTQFPVHKEEAHVLCMLPGRTFVNDMMAEMLGPEDQAVIAAG